MLAVQAGDHHSNFAKPNPNVPIGEFADSENLLVRPELYD
jgi:hypothetical protein